MIDHEVQAKVLLEIPEIPIHRLAYKGKTQLTDGTLRVCELEKPTKQKVYFLNMNSFYYTLSKETVFIKVVFRKNISYVYPHFDSGFCALTVNLTETKIAQLEEILSNIASLITYQQALQNVVLKEKLDIHCPNLPENEVVVSDKIQHVINVGGQYAEQGMKWLGGWISSGVNKLGGYLGQKVQHTGQTELSQSTKTKWESLKEGTGKIFTVSSQYVSAVLDPVVAKGKEVVGSINEKIDNSSSERIKYLKEVGATTAGAMKHAFNGVYTAVTEVGSSVSKNTQELWEKKYGEQPKAPLEEPPVMRMDAEPFTQNIEIEKKQPPPPPPAQSKPQEPPQAQKTQANLYPDINPLGLGS